MIINNKNKHFKTSLEPKIELRIILSFMCAKFKKLTILFEAWGGVVVKALRY